MHTKRLNVLGLAGAALLLTTALAARGADAKSAQAAPDPPSTAPTTDSAEAVGRSPKANVSPTDVTPTPGPARRAGQSGLGRMGGAGGAGGPPPFRERNDPPTDQELEDVREFMKEHSPKRYALYEQMSSNFPGRANRLLFGMLGRYRNLQRFREHDEAIYNILVRQIEVQDDVFELLRQGGLTDAELRARVRAKVAELVQLSLEEREQRIAVLERSVEEQKRQLAADKANLDSVIDRRLTEMKQNEEHIRRRIEGERRMVPPTPEAEGSEQPPGPR